MISHLILFAMIFRQTPAGNFEIIRHNFMPENIRKSSANSVTYRVQLHPTSDACIKQFILFIHFTILPSFATEKLCLPKTCIYLKQSYIIHELSLYLKNHSLSALYIKRPRLDELRFNLVFFYFYT